MRGIIISVLWMGTQTQSLKWLGPDHAAGRSGPFLDTIPLYYPKALGFTKKTPELLKTEEESTHTLPCAGPHRSSITGVTNSFLYFLSDKMLSTSYDRPRTSLVNYSYFGSVNKDQIVLNRQSCRAEKGSSWSRLGSQKRPSKEVTLPWSQSGGRIRVIF